MSTNGTEASWLALRPLVERHLPFARVSVEKHHAFTHEEVRRHAAWLDFDRLSDSLDVQWTEGLIEEFADRWNWETLTYSTLMMHDENLSDEFVERYRDRWDQDALDLMEGRLDIPEPATESHPSEKRRNMPSSEEIARYKDLTEGRWTQSRIEAEADTIDFSRLSRNWSVRWSIPLLTKYEDKWNWRCLATNRRIWDRRLKRHATAILDLLLATDPAALEWPPDASAFGVVPPHLHAGVAKVMSAFGPRSRVIGYWEA